MVKCLASTFGRGYSNAQVLFDLLLPDEVIDAARPEAGVKGSIFYTGFT